MNNKKILEELCDKLNLTLAESGDVAYGKLGIYPTICMPDQNGAIFLFSLRDKGTEFPQVKALKEIANANDIKLGSALTSENYALRVSLAGGFPFKSDRITERIEQHIACFKMLDWQPCCQVTGEIGNTTPYRTALASFAFLSQDGMKQMLLKKEDALSKKENVILGTIGSFFGALLGGLAIFIFLIFGRVSSLGGVCSGVAACIGYKFLGKKFSLKGAIISLFFAILSTVIMSTLYMNNILSEGFGVSFVSMLTIFPELLKEQDFFNEYLAYLAKPLITTLIGAALCVYAFFKESKHENKLEMLK